MKDLTVRMVINGLIMLPSIVLIIYVIPHLLGDVYLAPFIVLSLVPVMSIFVPSRFRSYVNPVVILIILMLILISLGVEVGNSGSPNLFSGFSSYIQSSRLLSHLVIPFTLRTFITFSMVISVTATIGGIKSGTIQRSISYLVLSLLPLLDQVFVLYLMARYSYSYAAAYTQAYEMQLVSWIALIFTGSTNIDGQRFPPPLQEYSFPVNPVMMVALIISLVAIISYFVFVQEKQFRSEALGGIGAAAVLGGIIAFIVFAVDQMVSSMGFQILAVAIAVFITAIYVVRSSPERKMKKLGKLPRTDKW